MLENVLIFIGAFFIVAGFVSFIMKMVRGLMSVLCQLDRNDVVVISISVWLEVLLFMIGVGLIVFRNGL